MKTKAFTIACITSLLLVPLWAQNADDRITIFIFTEVDPSGYVDLDQALRADAVKGAVSALSRSKVLRTTDTRDGAVIVVEVGKTIITKDEYQTLAALANNLNALGGGLSSLKPRLDETRRTDFRVSTLSVGSYSTELRAESAPALATGIEQFAKRNEAKLKSERK